MRDEESCLSTPREQRGQEFIHSLLKTVATAYALGGAGYSQEVMTATLAGLLHGGHHRCLLLAAVVARFHSPFRVVAGALLFGLGLLWRVKSTSRMHRHRRSEWVEQRLGRFYVSAGLAPTRFSCMNALVMTKSAAVEGLEACVIVSSSVLVSGE